MASPATIGVYVHSMRLGGAERVAQNLCTGLVERGYDVDLILVEATGELLEGVPRSVTIVDLGATRVATSLNPLRAYLSRREPDVLYSMLTEANVVAVAAHRLSGAETGLVVSEHNTLSRSTETRKDAVTTFCAGLLYPLADAVVAVSEGVKADLIAHTRLTADDVTVIYNPVDVDSIRARATESVGHAWLTDDALSVVVSGGRHESQKGFDTLLDAFSRLERETARLVLFGTGPETPSLKSRADALGIDDRVCFTGFVENPYKYMAAADVFVLSSVYEGFGLVLIEALACGCPVVSTDCESGPAEILENGGYGSLVPVGDAEAIAAAVDATLDSPPDPIPLRARADAFDIETAVSNYCALFDRTAPST